MKRLLPGLCLALAACTNAPLLHGDVEEKVQVGMSPAQVEQALGIGSYRKGAYGNGTSSWTYKYRDDANIHKLLHVTFGQDGLVQYTSTEWDPDVYSRGGGKRR